MVGQPIEAKKPSRRAAENADEAARKKVSPGLEPKTVVNTHRMLRQLPRPDGGVPVHMQQQEGLFRNRKRPLTCCFGSGGRI